MTNSTYWNQWKTYWTPKTKPKYELYNLGKKIYKKLSEVPSESYIDAGAGLYSLSSKRYATGFRQLKGAFRSYQWDQRRRKPRYLYIDKYGIQPSQRYLRRRRYPYRWKRSYPRRKRYRKKRLPYWLWLKNKRKGNRRYNRRYTTSRY